MIKEKMKAIGTLSLIFVLGVIVDAAIAYRVATRDFSPRSFPIIILALAITTTALYFCVRLILDSFDKNR